MATQTFAINSQDVLDAFSSQPLKSVIGDFTYRHPALPPREPVSGYHINRLRRAFEIVELHKHRIVVSGKIEDVGSTVDVPVYVSLSSRPIDISGSEPYDQDSWPSTWWTGKHFQWLDASTGEVFAPDSVSDHDIDNYVVGPVAGSSSHNKPQFPHASEHLVLRYNMHPTARVVPNLYASAPNAVGAFSWARGPADVIWVTTLPEGWYLDFTNGMTTYPPPGTVITGMSSGATAIAGLLPSYTGDFGAGTGGGRLPLTQKSGDFTAETVTYAGGSFVIAGDAVEIPIEDLLVCTGNQIDATHINQLRKSSEWIEQHTHDFQNDYTTTISRLYVDRVYYGSVAETTVILAGTYRGPYTGTIYANSGTLEFTIDGSNNITGTMTGRILTDISYSFNVTGTSVLTGTVRPDGRCTITGAFTGNYGGGGIYGTGSATGTVSITGSVLGVLTWNFTLTTPAATMYIGIRTSTGNSSCAIISGGPITVGYNNEGPEMYADGQTVVRPITTTPQYTISGRASSWPYSAASPPCKQADFEGILPNPEVHAMAMKIAPEQFGSIIVTGNWMDRIGAISGRVYPQYITVWVSTDSTRTPTLSIRYFKNSRWNFPDLDDGDPLWGYWEDSVAKPLDGAEWTFNDSIDPTVYNLWQKRFRCFYWGPLDLANAYFVYYSDNVRLQCTITDMEFVVSNSGSTDPGAVTPGNVYLSSFGVTSNLNYVFQVGQQGTYNVSTPKYIVGKTGPIIYPSSSGPPSAHWTERGTGLKLKLENLKDIPRGMHVNEISEAALTLATHTHEVTELRIAAGDPTTTFISRSIV